MADLFDYEPPARIYWDRKSYTSLEEHVGALRGSKTVYVGNLSFYTTEAQIYELFSKVGDVARVIMGLDRHKSTPCGFCFVEYFSGGDATASINFVHGTTLDERVIKVELDPGFRQGRQYGRGNAGGQVRDERRTDYDPARGGLGARALQEQQMGGGFGADEYYAAGFKRGRDDGGDHGGKRGRHDDGTNQ